MNEIYQSVQNYYGKILSKSSDLKTDACCTTEAPPLWLKNLLSNVHDDVMARYYGCGLVAPELLEGKTVLDLGCGAGRDVFVMAQMVGSSGRVIGVDMTSEQLNVAKKWQEWHAQKAGLSQVNTEFHLGYMENLSFLPDQSVDVVVSNCVINLSPFKDLVLKEIHRVLKPGGEFYFSDVYADRRLSENIRKNEVLWGECLAGALYWHDFLDLAKKSGFLDPRLVYDRPMKIVNEELEKLLSPAQFWSATYRLWKLPELESICEDYGQVVRYLGGIAGQENRYILDAHHIIEKGQSLKVCGNTWNMLKQTRLAPYFEFYGDFSQHFGAFSDCGISVPFSSSASNENSGSCC
jgi:arsenite methyltransferase